MFPVIRRRFTAYVVFVGAEPRRFWRIFLRRGWRHCLVVMPIYYPEENLRADVYSLIVNPLSWGVQHDVDWRRPEVLVQEALKNGATCVVKWRVDRKFDRDYVPRGLMTCVSLLKAMLAIQAWYVWTPEHLARWLLRNGGELMERSDDGRTIRGKKAEARQGNAGEPAPAEPATLHAGERRAERAWRT